MIEMIFNTTINLHDHNYDTLFGNIGKVKTIIYTPSFIWTIDLLLHLWSFMSLLKFILYLFQWELKLFTENVSKTAIRKCIILIGFPHFRSGRKRKRVCSEKSVFLHLSLSVNCNGLVWKRRWSILAELC